MSATATAAYEFKNALYTAAVELWKDTHPEFLVSWGRVGTNVPDCYVEFHGTDSDQQTASLSGTNRSRDEVIRLETQWFVTVWGEVDAAKEADEYLYARIRELEYYVRQTDTTLGGVVRECFLLSHMTDDVEIDNQNIGAGRLAAALAVFEAKVRITGKGTP
jgi:hypothetical protein